MGANLTISGNKGEITLEGDITLAVAEELKKTLVKAMIDSDTIAIGMRDVGEIDLSCLQLLCSAHRSAARMKKEVAFRDRPPQQFSEQAAAAGYSRHSGCKLDCNKSCLWVAKGGAVNG